MLLLSDILHFLNSIAIGAGFTIFIGLVSLAGYWLSHLKRVPISGRFKFVWYDQNFPKEFGHIRACLERQNLAAMHIEVLGVDEPVTQAVQSIINRLSRPQAANGHSFNLCLLVHPEAEVAESICGGTIFISTGKLLGFQTPGQLAAVLAHEMAHIIAGLESHASPRNAVTMLASPPIGEQLGRIEAITEDLSERRVLEAEADYIGLFLMAEAGFDPHERLATNDRETCRQSSIIPSQPTQPLLETFSTHPSDVNRAAAIQRHLPKAMAVFNRATQEPPVVTQRDWEIILGNIREGHLRVILEREFRARFQQGVDQRVRDWPRMGPRPGNVTPF